MKISSGRSAKQIRVKTTKNTNMFGLCGLDFQVRNRLRDYFWAKLRPQNDNGGNSNQLNDENFGFLVRRQAWINPEMLDIF